MFGITDTHRVLQEDRPEPPVAGMDAVLIVVDDSRVQPHAEVAHALPNPPSAAQSQPPIGTRTDAQP